MPAPPARVYRLNQPQQTGHSGACQAGPIPQPLYLCCASPAEFRANFTLSSQSAQAWSMSRRCFAY